MQRYIATVFKSGNSYALRVPKSYALDNNLVEGDKIELEATQKLTKRQNHERIQELFDELAAGGAFKDIKDPVAWQREIRKDRPLPGRE